MPQHEIVKILNFSNFFQHHLPLAMENSLVVLLLLGKNQEIEF
jgi:hypothetical protein